MYSNYKSIQILIALLKEYKIHNIIISPGGSNIPIVHSVENDEFFKCYSVVDERSALYFGMGVAQVENEPVACLCTSGTAVSNYLPGMTEAYYQNVPIIAITADKNPYFTGQIETQKINQKDIFGEVSKKSVDLPLCNTKDEIWYCERLIKEALVASTHHGKGPVHINLPVVGSYANYDTTVLPNVKPIKIVNCENNEETWKEYLDVFKKSKKILIFVGQNVLFTDNDIQNIETFFSKFNCMISVEHLSNLKCKGTIFTYPVTETGNTNMQDFVPDLVISLGNNLAAYCLKPFLRANNDNFRHISIDEGGRIRDVFQGLTDVFECTPSYFFKYFANNALDDCSNNMTYYQLWKDAVDRIIIPDFPFSNLYVAKKLSLIIPPKSILHLAILNSTRIMQFFKLQDNIRVFSNVGALGIDGCLSTFIGHSVAVNELAFLVIGDLSFFYDMNAAGIKHISNNIRIILLNNGGGSEFHFFMNKKDIPSINDNICAEHRKSARGWIESLGYEYYSASSKNELDETLQTFVKESGRPKFLEVFTDMETDANISCEFYNSNRPTPNLKQKSKILASKIKRKLL